MTAHYFSKVPYFHVVKEHTKSKLAFAFPFFQGLGFSLFCTANLKQAEFSPSSDLSYELGFCLARLHSLAALPFIIFESHEKERRRRREGGEEQQRPFLVLWPAAVIITPHLTLTSFPNVAELSCRRGRGARKFE